MRMVAQPRQGALRVHAGYRRGKTGPRQGNCRAIRLVHRHLLSGIGKGGREGRKKQRAGISGVSASNQLRVYWGRLDPKRLAILTRHLATFDPAFAPLLRASAPHSNGNTQAALEAEAESVSKLLYAVNEKFAATHGEDLFKLTNASAAAMMELPKAISDLKGYGSLVDAI